MIRIDGLDMEAFLILAREVEKSSLSVPLARMR
jgi:hypothetical protein